jgi:hypothetical protein
MKGEGKSQRKSKEAEFALEFDPPKGLIGGA